MCQSLHYERPARFLICLIDCVDGTPVELRGNITTKPLIAKFMRPTWGPSGAVMTPWSLISGTKKCWQPLKYSTETCKWQIYVIAVGKTSKYFVSIIRLNALEGHFMFKDCNWYYVDLNYNEDVGSDSWRMACLWWQNDDFSSRTPVSRLDSGMSQYLILRIW